ncbi:MAG: hypothetical protein IJT89_12380 [Bacteroidaceae bacterium]|nr:hypothetical protein [Bacteroidaceae bacterium]
MKSNILNRIMAAMAVSCSIFSSANAQTQTFTMATLNVDGLPGQVLFFDMNQDGPKSGGSERISEYLAAKGCDIFCLQENFNYRWEIWSRLFADYEHDEWSGGIILEEEKIDYAHLQNVKFKCDGLNMVWKKGIQTTNYERKAWQKSFGKFSHDFDDMITKGFRRHEFTLGDGSEIVVYNMHMDASSQRDEMKKNDGKDCEARLSQWIQLREDILERLDTRPVIIAGDMNSLYHRDEVKTAFIDAIAATGKATVGDAWIEKCNGGTYPVFEGEALTGELLDKILYINPTDGNSVVPTSVSVDKEGYVYDGTPLGDHYPLFATFEFKDRKASGVNQQNLDNQPAEIYDLRGIRQDDENLQKGIYIINGNTKVVK